MREIKLEATRRFRRTPKGVLTNLYSKMRERTKRNGLEKMDFSLKEFHETFLCDDQFLEIYQEWVESGFDTYKKPSVDRKDNEKGYSRNNIQILSWEENRRKGDAENSRVTTPIIMFDKNGNKAAEFESIKFAVEVTGFSQGNISMCCQGKREHVHGYKFRYRGDKFRKKPELLEGAK